MPNPAVHTSSGGVDVDLDVFPRVRGFQKEELSLNDVGDVIVHSRSEEDDSVGHQAREHVDFPEGHRTFFNHRARHVVRTRHRAVRGRDVIFDGVAAHAVVVHGVLQEFFAVVHGANLEAKLRPTSLTPGTSAPGCSQLLG